MKYGSYFELFPQNMNHTSYLGDAMIERPAYLEQLIKLKDNDMIKVITGVRRSGKSVLLMLYRDYLLTHGITDENIIYYYNFESLEVLNVRDADQLRDLLLSKLKKGVHQYVMLDEIQMVTEWQQIVNAIRVSYDCDIVITGSNAKMLSGELATLLSVGMLKLESIRFRLKNILLQLVSIRILGRFLKSLTTTNDVADFQQWY